MSSDMNFNHFFEVNVKNNEETKSNHKGFFSFSTAEYTPDGKQIILSGDVDDTENADRPRKRVFIVDNNGDNFI
jgi:hypothetical protein